MEFVDDVELSEELEVSPNSNFWHDGGGKA